MGELYKVLRSLIALEYITKHIFCLQKDYHSFKKLKPGENYLKMINSFKTSKNCKEKNPMEAIAVSKCVRNIDDSVISNLSVVEDIVRIGSNLLEFYSLDSTLGKKSFFPF